MTVEGIIMFKMTVLVYFYTYWVRGPFWLWSWSAAIAIFTPNRWCPNINYLAAPKGKTKIMPLHHEFFFEVHGVSGSVPATRKVVCNINQLGKQRLRIVLEVIILFCVFVIFITKLFFLTKCKLKKW